MLATSSRTLLLSATRAGGRNAIRALVARGISSPAIGSIDIRSNSTETKIFPTSHFQKSHQVAYKSAVPIIDDDIRGGYNSSSVIQGADACAKAGIANLGINGPSTIYKNQTFEELFQHEVANNEGKVAHAEYGDTFTVDTGKFTGRSPKDKWIVKNIGSESDANIDWGSVNQPTKPEVFDELYEKAVNHFNTLDKAYVFDGFCGANPNSQRKIRFVHEMAWQQHFVTNMFIRANDESDLDGFEPDFTVINACSQVDEDWERHGLNSEVAVVFNVEKKCAVIFGTWYGGENKKGIFSLMNYWLPMQGQFPMHCSANVGKAGDSALFFGLSGTGKTTLSADPNRALIGDDEHGWDEDGVFNFEGGCYAKTINLSEKTEPDIYRAIKKDAMLENVALKGDDLVPDYFDTSKTENGRVSYPIFHIDNYHEPQMAGHPKNIIFLSCDAFGVLPPIAKLTPEQAMYHFISGYTAKVAGTERGITEPTATFSACFGAAFLTLHPTRYAELLKDKLEKHNAQAWIVNSGWSGGPYGVGERMSIKNTRACINYILDGKIEDTTWEKDKVFGWEIPASIPDVDSKVLRPRNTWLPASSNFQEAIRQAQSSALVGPNVVNRALPYVGGGMVLTAGGVLGGLALMAANQALFMPLFWVALIGNFILFFVAQNVASKGNNATALPLLAAYSLITGFTLSGIVAYALSVAGVGAIGTATLATGITFVVASFAGRRMSDSVGQALSGVVGLGIIGLLIAMVVQIVGSLFVPGMFGGNGFELLIAGFGTVLFIGAAFVDFYTMPRTYSDDQYLAGALGMYLTYINLFIFILRLIIALQGGGRRD